MRRERAVRADTAEPFNYKALISAVGATTDPNAGSEGLAVELYCGTLAAGCAASTRFIPPRPPRFKTSRESAFGVNGREKREASRA